MKGSEVKWGWGGMGRIRVDQEDQRGSERIRGKRALNREIRADQEERSVVRRAGWSGVGCSKQYITIRVKRIKNIREDKSGSKKR